MTVYLIIGKICWKVTIPVQSLEFSGAVLCAGHVNWTLSTEVVLCWFYCQLKRSS